MLVPLQARNVLKRFQGPCYWVREELPVKEAILDGEVVALDSEGRQNFRDLMAGRGNLHYAAFDALWMDGRTCARCCSPGGSSC
jgi:ATP-dependent DNA ligase